MTPSLIDLVSRYPTNAQLRDGTPVVFVPFTHDDRDDMLEFTQALDEHDLLFLREDITSPATVDAWLMEVETGDTFTVLARVGGQLVGYSSLHTEPARWTRPRAGPATSARSASTSTATTGVPAWAGCWRARCATSPPHSGCANSPPR